jgi:hypothetical protein
MDGMKKSGSDAEVTAALSIEVRRPARNDDQYKDDCKGKRPLFFPTGCVQDDCKGKRPLFFPKLLRLQPLLQHLAKWPPLKDQLSNLLRLQLILLKLQV